jgi:hypothetical protein
MVREPDATMQPTPQDILASPFKSKLRLQAENTVLRHQLISKVPWEIKMENEAVIDDQEPGQTIVDKISDDGFTDGIEIRQIIELLREQNEGCVNDELSKTDAATAAMMVRNGLLTSSFSQFASRQRLIRPFPFTEL